MVIKNAFAQKYGPWAVVTGASDGIGRAVAAEAARHGLNVVLIARNETRLRTTAGEIEAEHAVKTRVVALDLSVPAFNASLFAQTTDLDVGLLCSVAGYGTSGNFLDNPIATELNMLDLNCRALTEQAHHFGQRFRARKTSGMVLMSSVLAFQGAPGAANYAATKGFVQTLAEGLHVELAPLGIDVLAAAPGPVRTGFATRAAMKMSQTDKPEVVAKAILTALGHQMTVRPGPLSKVLGASLSSMPRFLRVRMMGKTMVGMVGH